MITMFRPFSRSSLLVLLCLLFCAFALPLKAEPSLAEVEQTLRESLAQYEIEPGFTLGLETMNGRQFIYQQGDSSPFHYYEAASTAKLVTASVILYFVDKGVLSLDDRPQQYLNNWPTTGKLSQITLAHLLSFTSGLRVEPACINSPGADFSQCIGQIASLNQSIPSPGTTYHYRSIHLQVAGAMLINATQSGDWETVFNEFKSATGLFATSNYDLPSATNPNLASGMHWNGIEYFSFLRSLAKDTLYSKTFTPWLISYFGIFLRTNWIYTYLTTDWYYGLGFWVECPIKPPKDCGDVNRISSVGAFGAYPFIDYEHGYFGMIAMQGPFGSDSFSYGLTGDLSDLIEQWAAFPR